MHRCVRCLKVRYASTDDQRRDWYAPQAAAGVSVTAQCDLLHYIICSPRLLCLGKLSAVGLAGSRRRL